MGKKKKKKTQVDTDECIINYIQSESSQRPNKNNPKKRFLLSLLSDLEEINTAQFRTFRHDVVNLIDSLIGQPSIPYLASDNHQTTFPHHSDSSSRQSHTSEQKHNQNTLTCCTKNFNHTYLENQKIEL